MGHWIFARQSRVSVEMEKGQVRFKMAAPDRCCGSSQPAGCLPNRGHFVARANRTAPISESCRVSSDSVSHRQAETQCADNQPPGLRICHGVSFSAYGIFPDASRGKIWPRTSNTHSRWKVGLMPF